ncbi:helix-turn-helix domain-containing protein [Nonomuraea candida]|uniref:AraC-like ligand-binding domain-containing protein n=1 Tax=Nonomuraea candida TaxID=359159 RepID=UPI0005BB8F5D|nr:helix-turn-helix domain-containing protein [Nonomuraea candida]
MRVVLATAAVPDRDKLAFWRDAVSRTLVPVAVTPRGDAPFNGRIVADTLGYLRVRSIEADAARIDRTPALIAHAPEAFVAVGVQAAGTATVVQDGRRARLAEGDLVVYDTTRPYSFDFPQPFRAYVFQLPRRVLGLADDDLKQVTGTAIGTGDGVGAALLPFLTTLAASAGTFAPTVADRLAGNVTDLVATLVAERTRQIPRDADGARELFVRRVREYINQNLGDPALSPETIAQAHRISVRYLHRLFEGEGITVGRLIQQRRLDECVRELARRGRRAPTVSAVALRWGFVSPAHFSRAFRAVYGLSPQQWRTLRTAEGDGEKQQAAPAGSGRVLSAP